ncbi:hypothetical protein EDD17DRAFT_1487291 [Pisolithus thermaeus]|nr:hypothetical protein EV401DRAFT_1875457 [Pisolithus croceorrhizus]KAI6159100.1 hypothetical protein EDD17DRAFT_1487291 [Pisolithus thermaeus]
MVGYHGFEDGILKLKQVTRCDHHAIQCYIIGVISGAVPRRFLIVVHALVNFCYLAQAPIFTDHSLDRLTNALQLFHDNKDTVMQAGVQDTWEIPKLKLLQSVVSNIQCSGPVIQWSADTTKHAHIQEVKVPAQLSNNQNYYDQIAHYLDCSDKCFHFDVATYFETCHEGNPSEDDDDLEEEHDIELDFNNCSLCDHMNLPHLPLNYFVIANALACDSIPNAPKPHRTFSNITTTFHLMTKPSLCMTIDDAAILFKLPDLHPVIGEFLQCAQNHLNHPVSGVTSQDLHYPLPFDHIQIWYKIHIQQFLYHKAQDIDALQTLRVLPPSGDHPHGIYDMVILSPGPDSDWPQQGIEGHVVAQLRLIFCLLDTDYFTTYVQCFDVIMQLGNSGNVHPITGMHLLRRAMKSSAERLGSVVPISHICSPIHLIPKFDKEAHSHLTRESSCEFSNDFWLNNYWSKELYHTLSPLRL